MESLILALLLLVSVLISAVIDQLVPKISIPLIQIALGIVIAFLAPDGINITLDPELFLVLLIAPLLFNEAKNADKQALLTHIKPVVSLAVGLALCTAIIVGFALHLAIPTIPLAAAIALGAALGPTDAVAVTSLSNDVIIPERQKSILKGEMLINDASGIVTFQFALTAVIAGSFSLIDATGVFVAEFFGGLACGAVLGFLINFTVRWLRNIGVDNTTFHVLLEVCTPLVVYLLAGAIHVSGIIAVVVAGLVNVISPRMIGPSISRMNIVSSSVWRVLSFALNGIVFVLLGTQLPNAMRSTWDDITFPNASLILYTIGLALLVLLIRFVWVLCMDMVHARRGTRKPFTLHDVKLSLITTLCGVRGTISLSILFTIPVYISVDPTFVRFPQRDLLIFLACGVILITLLLANLVVPIISPKPNRQDLDEKARKKDREATIEIMRNVIEGLVAQETGENRFETRAVIRSYNERLAQLKDSYGIEEQPNLKLRIEACQWEMQRAAELIESGGVSPLVGYQYMRTLEQRKRLMRHHSDHHWLQALFARARLLVRWGFHALIRELPHSMKGDTLEERRMLHRETCACVIGKLEQLVAETQTPVPTEDASRLLLEYQELYSVLSRVRPSLSTRLETQDRAEEVRRLGLDIEMEQIDQFYEDGKLSRAAARQLRENVNLMRLDLDDRV